MDDVRRLFQITLIFLTFIPAFVLGDANITTGCSNKCSQQDYAFSDCWEATQEYFDKNLIDAMNEWIKMEVNVDQWNRRHNPDYEHSYSTENLTEQAVARLNSYMPSDSQLSAERLRDAVLQLLNETFSRSTAIIDVGLPEVHCPIPCNYETHLWEYLFIASILINIAMVIVVIPFIIKSERRDKQLYAKQASMIQMLKPTTKSRNPSTVS